MAAHPFGRSSAFEVGPNDVIYYGSNDTLGVRGLPVGGGEQAGFTARHAPVAVTKRDVERALSELGKEFTRELERDARDTWPAYRNMVVDDLGRAWFAIIGPEGATVRWEVRQLDGTLLTSVNFPGRFTLHRVRAGIAYGVSTDELDVPKVVWYRVPIG